ncbi:MAG TPA: glycosyltransferase family 9 protein [Blastocatellia bacterium]|nr:glycosyltransferase family 9 protein [Blastocatellia bacterium]
MSLTPPYGAARQTEAGFEAKVDWSNAASVLLVRLRSIGDTVLMTAAFDAIKSWRPQIRITVVSEPTAAPLLEGHGLIDELVVSGPSAASRFRLLSRLRRNRYDVAFNLHGGSTATFITSLSGARHTVGYKDYRYSWMLGARAPSPDKILGRRRIHSVEQQLALLKWSGIPLPAKPRLSLPEGASIAGARALIHARLEALGPEWAERLVGQIAGRDALRGYAVISPAASAESKTWPAKHFASVVHHLSERWNVPSVIIAGKGEESIATCVASSSRCGPAVFTDVTLKELAALLSGASVFIGNDSGPMHIAAAYERPLVAIFGSSNPEVWHPWTTAPCRVVTSAGVYDLAADPDFETPASGRPLGFTPGVSAPGVSAARPTAEEGNTHRIKAVSAALVIQCVDGVMSASIAPGKRQNGTEPAPGPSLTHKGGAIVI